MVMHNRYLDVHNNPTGIGDARPTALDIIKDEHLEGRLADKVILITGASANLGAESAIALATTGAKLFCTARDIKKAEAALEPLLASNPEQVTILQMDQSSLSSVRRCAEEFLSKSSQLNILICNAGIMAVPTLEKSADGNESQFATNHLSHFLLFKLLQPTLIASSTPTFASRVVMVASSGHRHSEVQHDNYDFSSTAPNAKQYSPFGAYGQSKTANIYMANEIDRRYGPSGLHGLSLHPGGIRSNLQKHMDQTLVAKWDVDPVVQRWSKSPAQGAATQVYAAVSHDWEGKGGRYLEDCDEAPDFEEWKAQGGEGGKGCKPYIYEVDKAKRLWKDSLKIVGLPAEEEEE